MTGQPTTGNLVTCDIEQGVALVTWPRPERRNAWTVPMEQEYFALLYQCTANPEVQVIVVTGAGAQCPARYGLEGPSLVTPPRSGKPGRSAPLAVELPRDGPQADDRRYLTARAPAWALTRC